jgi:hypothetical protein
MRPHRRRLKPLKHLTARGIKVERLARKNIDVGLIRIIAKMSYDIRGLDELNHCPTRQVRLSFAEVHNLWFAVCDHIDLLNKVFNPCIQVRWICDQVVSTTVDIEKKLVSPTFILH